jgi:cellulose synthase/poly-beta-1,6-N-acetylglucosamine synthase-like glycosyltransferase
MIRSFKVAPRLESFDGRSSQRPRVSIILPARNEEKYIARCLDSLLAQDYGNYEIVAINDSSTDATGKIIQEYSARDSRVVYVNASPKPEGWVGKNWACHQGYLASDGDLLLFTDADTEHASNTMSLAVQHLLSEHLDALTAVPHLVCIDFWTKITLPSLSTFLHTRFSPLRVNDPKTKTGYFFGSFFVITRSTYEAVGTHQAVKQELVEDGALGGKVKSSGFRLKMVRGERHIDAVWARDLETLWQGLRRLMMPIYYQDRKGAGLMALAVVFILFVPFLTLPYSVLGNWIAAPDITGQALLLVQLAAVTLIIVTTAVQCARGIYQNPCYALAAPLSGALVSLGFFSAIADARGKGTVTWRSRKYSVTQNQHPVY